MKLKTIFLSYIIFSFTFLTMSCLGAQYNCFKEFLKKAIPPKNISKAEYQQFLITKRIYHIIWEIKKQEKILAAPGGKLYPEQKQTNKGFFLEYHYKHPYCLYTPWGTLTLIGSFTDLDWHNANHKILKYLQAQRINTLNNNLFTLDHEKSLYAIYSANNIPLNSPVIKKNINKHYVDPNQEKENWDIMHNYYYTTGDHIKSECCPLLIPELKN